MTNTIALGIIGSELDSNRKTARWQRWRPSVAICQQEDLLIDRFELIHDARSSGLARFVREDIATASPETKVALHEIHFDDPWDFEEVYAALHNFARGYSFDQDREDYLIHITTGTHVQQICLFLLTESRHFPGRLLQASPPKRGSKESAAGSYRIIDLDLSNYDQLASRFELEQREGLSFLKSGIETQDAAFNRLIEQIEQVAVRSDAPMLLTGPTGAGKTQLARRIYELKKLRQQIGGAFVEVNCATLRGDQAMSTLFGHVKGAFTGAMTDRAGLLCSADGGLLFLDEIGELRLDEQAMLLRAVEDKRFLPVGADEETSSDFQLVAGTNRDLQEEMIADRFREDLLARINLWTFRMPGLVDRRDDIAPNIEYELEQHAAHTGKKLSLSKEAANRFLTFATSNEAVWSSNFRDLNAAITRMATLALGGRITRELVDEEIARLKASWISSDGGERDLREVLGEDRVAELDLFDQTQLTKVMQVCRTSKSLADAGRKLFAVSRLAKQKPNDADRLRKYLLRFGLSWQDVQLRIARLS
jgi:transcriptional regulatory protein RtcR